MAADLVHQGMGVALDLQRVLAQQIRRAGLVDVGGRGLRVAERLAQPDQAFVGMKLDPDQLLNAAN